MMKIKYYLLMLLGPLATWLLYYSTQSDLEQASFATQLRMFKMSFGFAFLNVLLFLVCYFLLKNLRKANFYSFLGFEALLILDCVILYYTKEDPGARKWVGLLYFFEALFTLPIPLTINYGLKKILS